MDIEFHYHVTAIVARHAGFGEADAAAIGHGAQFVDDNHAPRMVLDARARPVFRSLPTQARGLFGPWALMRSVYPVFHFVPGRERDMSPRTDGAVHPLLTTPDAPGARALLAAAFHADPDTRLMRVAVASHAYADTWAHQNFAGMRHPVNSLGRGFLPTLGHAAGLRRPDRVGLRWTDPRLADPRVDNGTRFMAAARALHARYREHLRARGGATWEELAGPLAEVLNPPGAGPGRMGRSGRMAAYARLAPWLPPYDPLAWEREALAPWEEALHEGRVHEGRVEEGHVGEGRGEDAPRRAPAPMAQTFAWRTAQPGRTNWHRFQEAARDHLRLGLRLFAPALAEAGLSTELPEVLADLSPAPVAEPEPGLELADLLAAAGDPDGPGEESGEESGDAADAEVLPLAGVGPEA